MAERRDRAPDTVVEPFPFTSLAKPRSAKNCRIRSFSVISDSQIARPRSLFAPGCIIDAKPSLLPMPSSAPYSHLRPGSDIGGEISRRKLSSETKQVENLAKASKANHLFLSGRTAEIGAGREHRAPALSPVITMASKNILPALPMAFFVGSNSTLVAPISIGTQCRTSPPPAFHALPMMFPGRFPRSGPRQAKWFKEGWGQGPRREAPRCGQEVNLYTRARRAHSASQFAIQSLQIEDRSETEHHGQSKSQPRNTEAPASLRKKSPQERKPGGRQPAGGVDPKGENQRP